MHSFSANYLKRLSISPSISIIYGLCAEAKGKQGHWKTVRPDIFTELKEQSIISSTESSNRIEGVEVDEQRLRPLIAGKVNPQNRPEEEILGYKNALDWIHRDEKKIDITPETIQELHRLAQSGLIGDAGKWKEKSNEIIELRPDGRRLVRFAPPPPEVIPEMLSQLCLGYRDCVNHGTIPDLVAVAGFVFDFLCIHPFRDGNGRVSRLLTLLLLLQHDYEVGRYISIEKIIEDTKEAYYASLKDSSIGWHEQNHSLEPFWRYFLTTIRTAYDQLENRVAVEDVFKGAKSELIRRTILKQTQNFKLSDIANIENNASKPLIKKVLYQLRDEGLVELHGKGRSAYWRKVG